MPNERIALAVRGEWLRLELELDYPPGNPSAPLVQAAAEELWLTSRVLELVGRYQAGRAARRVDLDQHTAPTGQHAAALAYLEEVPLTADEDLALALDPDTIEGLENELGDLPGTIADVYDLEDDHDDDHEVVRVEPDVDAGEVFARLREDRNPNAIEEGELMRACQRLTAAERLAPGRPLARELGIAPRLAGTAVQKARRRGWLPEVVDLAELAARSLEAEEAAE